MRHNLGGIHWEGWTFEHQEGGIWMMPLDKVPYEEHLLRLQAEGIENLAVEAAKKVNRDGQHMLARVEREWANPADYAAEVGTSRQAVMDRIKRGTLEALRVNGVWRVKPGQ